MIKIPITLQIAVLTVALTGFYMMVGQAVPQKEVQPPQVIEISQDLGSAEMVALGKEIFEGKGICSTCHKIGASGAQRFPDLAGVATRAGSREPGVSALDYLAQSLYEPGAFIVPGFNPGMPPANKPPIGLTDDEILTVIAFLQSLGGEPTVTMKTKLVYTGGTHEGAAGGDGAAGDEAASDATDVASAAPASVLAKNGCTACHYEDKAGKLKASSLYDVGARLDRDQLLVKTIYHPGEKVLGSLSQDEIQAMVQRMSELKGEG